MKPDVFEYKDYRLFLEALYEFNKVQNKKYSFRKFSEDFGFSTSSFLYLVVKGKRNLSLKAIHQISDKMNWRAMEKKYFLHLVHFCQEKTKKEKQEHFIELEKILGKTREVINPDQFAYYSNWYIPILREIIALKGFVSHLDWIKKKFWEPVSEEAIKKGIATLERLKMIKKQKNKWMQASAHLTTPATVSSSLIHNFHKEMIGLGQKSLDLPAGLRDISTMTISLNHDQYEWLKQRIIDFRDELQQEIQTKEQEDGQDPTMVAQVNIQVFPVTR